jgi:cyclopropane fatty-acyl-phospholipid synthase-like methyltransferase
MSTKNIEEELFCMQFELEAMANLVIHNRAERWVYKYMFNDIEQEHLARYKFAIGLTSGKEVLDVACGSGYGSYLLATEGNAAKVQGFDLDESAIRYGNYRYKHPNVNRAIKNVLELSPELKFDVVVSFETIEHIPDYRLFLANMQAALKADGLLMVSTPIVEATSTKCNNPHHVIEWSFNDFSKLISEYFSIETVYVQSIKLRSDRPKNSLFHRVIRKITGKYPNTNFTRPVFEKFTNQYNTGEITQGYQVLVCKHK